MEGGGVCIPRRPAGTCHAVRMTSSVARWYGSSAIWRRAQRMGRVQVCVYEAQRLCVCGPQRDWGRLEVQLEDHDGARKDGEMGQVL